MEVTEFGYIPGGEFPDEQHKLDGMKFIFTCYFKGRITCSKIDFFVTKIFCPSPFKNYKIPQKA